MPKSDALLGKNIPFVQAHHIGKKQRPTAIVLRTSFTTSDGGAAHGIAQAWHNSNNRIDSCHYVIDERQIIRCIPDNRASRSIYTSSYRKAITINVCYDPPSVPLDVIVNRTAKQVARLCKLHRIKLRLLTKEQELEWLNRPWKHRGGIILKTAGYFPSEKFFTRVQDEYRGF
jgi:N-acetylmuramoyl-L-alanine amidase CwlA